MIAVVIGSESSLSVSTQSQGGHRQSDGGVGGSEIRPGQWFQVQDQPETDRAGLGGAWEEHCVTTLQFSAESGRSSGERREREGESHLPHSPGGRTGPRPRESGGRPASLTRGSGDWSIFCVECRVEIRII